MIMISTGAEFDEFVTRLKDKFGFRGKIRCKIRDEDGDGMISLSDQEDLDMALSSSKKAARRDRADVGKLEVRRERDYSYNKPPMLNGASFCPSVQSSLLRVRVFFAFLLFRVFFSAPLPSRKTSCCHIRKFEFHPLTKRLATDLGHRNMIGSNSQPLPHRSHFLPFLFPFFFFVQLRATLLRYSRLSH